MKKSTRPATVILFVLCIFAVLCYVLVHIIAYAQVELKGRASSSFDASLRVDAYNALHAVIAELEEFREADGGLYSSQQGWGNCFNEGRITLPSGSDVEVTVSDISGKIPLANLKSDELALIFEIWDLPSSTAKKLADCLIDWTDSDDSALLNGAEKNDYKTNEALPPNRPLKSYSELFYIKGFREYFYDENDMPNMRYEAFVKIFSLYEFRDVNLNSTTPQVLEAMLKMEAREYDESLFNAIRGIGVSISDGISWVKNITEIRERGVTPPSKNAVCESTRLKIDIRIRRGVGEYLLSAVYGAPEQSSSRRTSEASNSSAAPEIGRILKIMERASNID